jgi:hypothetical protein
MLDRAAPRDLFDVATLSHHGAMGEPDRLRAATVLLGSFRTEDFRARLDRPHIADIGEREVRSALWPSLRKDLRPSVEDLRASAEPALGEILALGDPERRYLHSFYEDHRFHPLPLFEGTEAEEDLPQHPMGARRMKQLERRRPPDKQA